MSAIRLSETHYSQWSSKTPETAHVVCDTCLMDEVSEALDNGLTVVIRGVTIAEGSEGTYYLWETEGTATKCEGWDCPDREDEDEDGE